MEKNHIEKIIDSKEEHHPLIKLMKCFG